MMAAQASAECKVDGGSNLYGYGMAVLVLAGLTLPAFLLPVSSLQRLLCAVAILGVLLGLASRLAHPRIDVWEPMLFVTAAAGMSLSALVAVAIRWLWSRRRPA